MSKCHCDMCGRNSANHRVRKHYLAAGLAPTEMKANSEVKKQSHKRLRQIEKRKFRRDIEEGNV